MATLKEQNRLQLACLVGAPLLLILLLQIGAKEAITLVGAVTSAGIMLVAVCILVMLSDLLPQQFKHMLVFLRLKNPLPGHRCDKVCLSDSRLDNNQLLRDWPQVFGKDIASVDRNRLWYTHIYKPVADAPGVMSAHKKFLLYRDAAAGSLVMFLLLLIWYGSGFDMPYLGKLPPWHMAIEAAFLAPFMVSAHTHGTRMVANAAAEHAKG